MEKILNAILDFIKDKNDGYSYKRLTGIASFVVAAWLAFDGKDAAVVGLFLAVCTANAGWTVCEKKD